MKYLLIIFLLLSPSVSWSEDISFDDLALRDGLFYEKFTDVLFTGKVIGEKQGKISKGKREGEWLWYWENGQLKEKVNYKDGKLEGEWLMYRKNGQLYSKNYYKDGKPEGEWLEYNQNGRLLSKENYKDGKFIETIKP